MTVEEVVLGIKFWGLVTYVTRSVTKILRQFVGFWRVLRKKSLWPSLHSITFSSISPFLPCDCLYFEA